ncbi:MAG: glycosyltransferase family 4 protein [Bacteroidota bacterium]
MNILFLTLIRIKDIEERGIYTDLMREFVENGHQVHIARPSERRYGENTTLNKIGDVVILNVKTLNLQETNLIEKGLATLFLEYQFLKATKKYFSNIKFDLILYSTPPITFTKVVAYFKKRDQAKSYLLLKDIFPQNAVDLKMISKGGILHKYFSKKEKQLYAISDYIGCMSPANVDFLLRNNSELNPVKVEINPNSISPVVNDISITERNVIRLKYKLPTDKVIFVYGGNLGKPQGISFLIEALEALNNDLAFFLIIGSGTAYSQIRNWFDLNQPTNAILFSGMPKTDYDKLLRACDVGMIFLDPHFTIPNFPSRLLSYMECKLPVLAATDTTTDIGTIIVDNDFGFWCENGDLLAFEKYVLNLSKNLDLRKKMGEAAIDYLKENYLAQHSYEKIIRRVKGV